MNIICFVLKILVIIIFFNFDIYKNDFVKRGKKLHWSFIYITLIPYSWRILIYTSIVQRWRGVVTPYVCIKEVVWSRVPLT